MKQKIDFILFGATGDLATRKIIPALFSAFCKGALPEDFRLIATGRSQQSAMKFASKFSQFSTHEKWPQFCKCIKYLSLDLTNFSTEKLAKSLRKRARQIAYFSISPSYFLPAANALGALNLPNLSLMLEKPLGLNLAEFCAIDEELKKHFKEEQILRIDHYLGKEMVQQLLSLRANCAEFDALCAAPNLRSLTIGIYENIGVQNRGEFYDKCGALRDMLQNHALQMLCLFAIDAHASDIRAAKCDFIASLEPFSASNCAQNIIRKQYAGYLSEPNIAPNSRTETYAALKTMAKSGRLANVPIYLISGKKMRENQVFLQAELSDERVLYIRVQPDAQIILQTNDNGVISQEQIALQITQQASPYERLICEALVGKFDNFASAQELKAAWQWLDAAVTDTGYELGIYEPFSI